MILHGVFGLLMKPILMLAVAICFLGLRCFLLSLYLMALFTVFLLAVAFVKLYLYLTYIWSTPELISATLTEVYSQPGNAFFVAEVDEEIVGCIGLQRSKAQVI